MSTSSLGASMGSNDGDYIKLENQWARVTITREHNGNGMPEFVLTGDLQHFRDHRRVFTTMRGAMACAMESLAMYQRGRVWAMNTAHLSVLLLLSLLLTGCSAVPLSRVNQGLEVSYQTAHVIDVLQTWHGQALDKCYEESDPLVKRLIGRNPSTGGVLAWGVGEAAVHYGVYRLLADHGHDRLAAVWEAVTVTATVATVANNYSIGVRVGAKNTDKGCPAERMR